MRSHQRAIALESLSTFFELLDANVIDATLLSAKTPAVELNDRLDGWHRIYADANSVVHLRRSAMPNDRRATNRPDHIDITPHP